MPTYVALVRALNLGSHNRISMADLRSVYARIGAEDVTTYVQSGNVVFRTGARNASTLERALERQIRADLGLEVAVLVRTGAELAAIVAGNPFDDATSVHVTFLADKPSAGRLRGLDPARSQGDEFRVVGREVYLHCPNGYGRSKLTNAFFEKQLGVAATTRNWKTVTKLTELAAS